MYKHQILTLALKQKQQELENDQNTIVDPNPWWHLAMMISYPVIIGLNDNTKRKLKGLHENTRTLYMAPFLIVVCSIVISMQGIGFAFFQDLSFKTYLMFIFISGFNIICQAISMIAYRHCEASKLAIYSYLSTPL